MLFDAPLGCSIRKIRYELFPVPPLQATHSFISDALSSTSFPDQKVLLYVTVHHREAILHFSILSLSHFFQSQDIALSGGETG